MSTNTKKGVILIAFGIIGMFIFSYILLLILNLVQLGEMGFYLSIPISVIRLGFIILGVLQIMDRFNVDKYFNMNKYLKTDSENLNQRKDGISLSKIENNSTIINKPKIEKGLKISLILIILFSIGLLSLAFKEDVDGSHYVVFLISIPNMVLLYFLNKKEHNLYLFILLIVQTLFAIFIISAFYVESGSGFGLGILLAYSVVIQILYLIIILFAYNYIRNNHNNQ